MANQEHLDRLKKGTDAWNAWRKQFLDIKPDLNGADLRGTDLRGANLIEANLTKANLAKAILTKANLAKAILIEAEISEAILRGADLCGALLRSGSPHRWGANLWKADLSESSLAKANLSYANLRAADLAYADLSGVNLIQADFTDATLSGCRVYGSSVWNVRLQGTKQDSLIITPVEEAEITVDTLEIAQFIYLLVNNPTIRHVIDTIAKKAVLILGRFTPERKAILELLRDELRSRGYVPILFDFQKPDSKDLTETVSILAHLSRFVLVDLTDPSSTPYEVGTIAGNCITPLQPLVLETKHEFAMFADLQRRYHWVLPIYHYKDADDLRASLDTKIIIAVEQKAQELIQSQ
jgi:uncharacterized protein YjbI with pentapeptide repeats